MKIKTGKNIGYTLSASVILMFIGVFTTSVLISILSPFDFGIIAIATSLTIILKNIDSSGIDTAILQKGKNGINQLILSNGFTLKFVISILLFSASYFFSPYWSSIYEEPLLIPLIRFLAIIFVLNSFSLIPDILIRVNLDFKKRSVISVIRALIRSITVLTFAFSGYGFWSIVYADILATLFQAIAFNYFYPWKLRIKFDRKVAVDLLSFSKWLLFANFCFGF